MKTQIKRHYLPLILIILGVIDQSTDLLIQLCQELNLPTYATTIFRILVIILGAFKLYVTQSNEINE
jgi:hypothetical protein